MRRLIIAPARYGHYITDEYNILFSLLKSEFGFETQFSSIPEVPGDVEIVISAHPHNWKKEGIEQTIRLNKSVKVIGYVSDINAYCSRLDIVKAFMERCNVIISCNNTQFKMRWPKHINKFIHFPNSFAPYERYTNLEYNKNPTYKCLLSGRYHHKYYPLREFILLNRDISKIDMLPHPGGTPKDDNKKYYIGDRFAALLNSYFCCVTAASIYDGTIAKYFEIPAAGALLFANEVPDLKILGYVPDEHYISITKDNVFEKIYKCLDNPHRYEKIRKSGMNFVRENHSIKNRFMQLKKIINGML